MTSNISDAEFWQDLYRRQEDGWDLGRAAPPLARFVAARPLLVDKKRVLVVGCGRGHDARMLAKAGGVVTAVDFADQAVADARRLAADEGLTIDIQQGDVFALRGQYDVVVEHTCFCAIDPARRVEYAHVISRLLVDGGHLLALFYAHNRPGGPPFGTNDAELDRIFLPLFTVDHRETPADSTGTRAGNERLMLLQRGRRA